MPKYNWDEKSLYAINEKTGKEVVYGEAGDISIREAQEEDIRRLIFKTENMKKIIKMVSFIFTIIMKMEVKIQM